MIEADAMQHLDALALAYTGCETVFGHVVPAELGEGEVPVLCRILPQRVVALDAT